LRVALELHFFVTEASIDQAVQRHGIGGLRGAGKAGQQRDGQKRLLHLNPQNGEMKGALRGAAEHRGPSHAATLNRAAMHWA